MITNRPLLSLALLGLAASTLAACSEADVSAPASPASAGGGSGADPGGGSGDAGDGGSSENGDSKTRVVMAETGWLTVGEDGAVYTTHFDADGTYRDFRGGQFMQQGSWRRDEDGRLCFTPADKARFGECWNTKGLRDDGTMRAVDADGGAIRLKKITYLPPVAADSETGGDDGADGAGANAR